MGQRITVKDLRETVEHINSEFERMGMEDRWRIGGNDARSGPTAVVDQTGRKIGSGSYREVNERCYDRFNGMVEQHYRELLQEFARIAKDNPGAIEGTPELKALAAKVEQALN